LTLEAALAVQVAVESSVGDDSMHDASDSQRTVNRLDIMVKRLFGIWHTGNIRVARRVIVSMVGATVLLIGIALLVLPGPAFIVIPLGLAILATEYAWARRWLKKVRQMAADVVSRRSSTAPEDSGV
jgi:Flp pilus assembly protein TadB